MGTSRILEEVRYGSSSGPIHRVEQFTFDNDEIKGLVSNALVISSTPPSTKWIVGEWIEVKVDAHLGAYSNVDTIDCEFWGGSFLSAASPQGVAFQTAFCVNDSGLSPPATDMNNLLTNMGINQVLLLPFERADATSNSWGKLAKAVSNYNSFLGLPWAIKVYNGGLTDFTGGNAGNVMRTTFSYYIL